MRMTYTDARGHEWHLWPDQYSTCWYANNVHDARQHDLWCHSTTSAIALIDRIAAQEARP